MTEQITIEECEANAIDWPDSAHTPKKIVFMHADGMMEIIGHTQEQPPTLLEYKGEPVNLVACKSRYYVYKRVMVPENSGTFTTGQGHFDKGQR